MRQNENVFAQAAQGGIELTRDDDGRYHVIIDPTREIKNTGKSILHAQSSWLTLGWDDEGHKTYLTVTCGTTNKVDKRGPGPVKAATTDDASNVAPTSPEAIVDAVKQNPAMMQALLAALGASNAAPAPVAPEPQKNAPAATEAPETDTTDDSVTPRHRIETDDELDARMGTQKQNTKRTRKTNKAGQGTSKGATRARKGKSQSGKRSKLTDLIS